MERRSQAMAENEKQRRQQKSGNRSRDRRENLLRRERKQEARLARQTQSSLPLLPSNQPHQHPLSSFLTNQPPQLPLPLPAARIQQPQQSQTLPADTTRAPKPQSQWRSGTSKEAIARKAEIEQVRREATLAQQNLETLRADLRRRETLAQQNLEALKADLQQREARKRSNDHSP